MAPEVIAAVVPALDDAAGVLEPQATRARASAPPAAASETFLNNDFLNNDVC